MAKEDSLNKETEGDVYNENGGILKFTFYHMKITGMFPSYFEAESI